LADYGDVFGGDQGMMGNRLMLGALTIVTMSTGAIGQTQPDIKPAAKVTAQAKAADTKICRTVVVTGSRLGGKKICGSRQEWDDRQRRDREMIDDMSRVRRLPN
jgi:hypothetical protein